MTSNLGSGLLVLANVLKALSWTSPRFTTRTNGKTGVAILPLYILFSNLPRLLAHPLFTLEDSDVTPKPPNDPSLWIYLGTAVFLVLAGGAFAGLTIA
jgi:hypothetical protein